VLTSVLSCLNSGLYTASRMAFSLGRRGDAPKVFARTTSRGVPMAAIIASVVFGFVAVFFNYAYPDTVFLFLVNSSGAVALFVWLVICFSQLRLRRIIERETPEKLVVKMWLYPYLTWATIALIVFVLGYMLTDTEGESSGRTTVLLSLMVAAVVLAIAVIRQKVGAGASSVKHAVADEPRDEDPVKVG
jgi:GABA permease